MKKRNGGYLARRHQKESKQHVLAKAAAAKASRRMNSWQRDGVAAK
jgi:hypothetical protein